MGNVSPVSICTTKDRSKWIAGSVYKHVKMTVPVTYLILAVVSVGVGLFTLFTTRRNQHQYSYDGGSRYRDYGVVSPLPPSNYSEMPRRTHRNRKSQQQLSIEQSNSPLNVEEPTVISEPIESSIVSTSFSLESESADGLRLSTSSSESFDLIPESRSEMCTICYEFISDDIFSTTKCNHSFHYFCLVEWLKRESVCPNCRGPLKLK